MWTVCYDPEHSGYSFPFCLVLNPVWCIKNWLLVQESWDMLLHPPLAGRIGSDDQVCHSLLARIGRSPDHQQQLRTPGTGFYKRGLNPAFDGEFCDRPAHASGCALTVVLCINLVLLSVIFGFVQGCFVKGLCDLVFFCFVDWESTKLKLPNSFYLPWHLLCYHLHALAEPGRNTAYLLMWIWCLPWLVHRKVLYKYLVVVWKKYSNTKKIRLLWYLVFFNLII